MYGGTAALLLRLKEGNLDRRKGRKNKKQSTPSIWRDERIRKPTKQNDVLVS